MIIGIQVAFSGFCGKALYNTYGNYTYGV